MTAATPLFDRLRAADEEPQLLAEDAHTFDQPQPAPVPDHSPIEQVHRRALTALLDAEADDLDFLANVRGTGPVEHAGNVAALYAVAEALEAQAARIRSLARRTVAAHAYIQEETRA